MALLITGGCGFIGSGFINYYFSKVDTVIVNIDAMYYCAREMNVSETIRQSERYKFVNGNICSADLIRHILKQYDVKKVIHFAAQSHVQNSFDDSLQFTKDNILGTHVLLEECRKHGIELFVHVSTDEVYGESMLEETEKTEASVLCPTNPYAATKAAAELISRSYYHSYNMPIIITRGNNVYGPNQYPEKIIPKFIKLLKDNKPVTIQGDGSNIRSFLHVTDVARAFESVLNHGVIGEIYNLGADPDEEYTVMNVAKRLIEAITGHGEIEDWIEFIPDRPFNDKRYFISNDKLKKLGWSAQITFEKGLQDTIKQFNISDWV